jgi:hypothetical protein
VSRACSGRVLQENVRSLLPLRIPARAHNSRRIQQRRPSMFSRQRGLRKRRSGNIKAEQGRTAQSKRSRTRRTGLRAHVHWVWMAGEASRAGNLRRIPAYPGPLLTAVRVRGLPGSFGAGLRATAHRSSGHRRDSLARRPRTIYAPKPLEGLLAFVPASGVIWIFKLAERRTVTLPSTFRPTRDKDLCLAVLVGELR